MGDGRGRLEPQARQVQLGADHGEAAEEAPQEAVEAEEGWQLSSCCPPAQLPWCSRSRSDLEQPAACLRRGAFPAASSGFPVLGESSNVGPVGSPPREARGLVREREREATMAKSPMLAMPSVREPVSLC